MKIGWFRRRPRPPKHAHRFVFVEQIVEETQIHDDESFERGIEIYECEQELCARQREVRYELLRGRGGTVKQRWR